MLIVKDNLDEALSFIDQSKELALDTETYPDAEMFALQLAGEKGELYFNFLDYGDGTPYLDRSFVCDLLRPFFNEEDRTWFMHNAKFDLHRLLWEDVFVEGRVHDTMVAERLIYNQYMKYGLDAVLKRRGEKKDDAVEKYIKEHKLYEMRKTPGKATKKKVKFFHKVPFDIMYKYGLSDARLTYWLGKNQQKEIPDSSHAIFDEECRLVKTCLRMEDRGALSDQEYARRGWKHEEENIEKIEKELEEVAGTKYRNGPNWLTSVFEKFEVPFSRNPETGNPIFDKEALERINHPIAELVLKRRKSEKYISTYYSTFANNSVVKPDVKQSGTYTGRFSYSNPNLQNVPKEEDSKKGDIEVRKCITPREGHSIVAIDFSQQEYRLMLDYANERKLIKQVMEGACVHQATANLVGCTRSQAKTLNFGLLYGMGNEKLAKALNISIREAEMLKLHYFGKIPRVEDLIYRVINTARKRRWIKTWAGRVLQFPLREICYKSPNHLIQGGCADMTKIAMNKCDDWIQGKGIYMLIQVHDEIVFEVRDDYIDYIYTLKSIMEDVYEPKNGMYMKCSIEKSSISWGKQDLEEIA